VTLLLEGTWPGCIGGITTWVQDLIVGLPDVAFHVVRIGPPVDRWVVERPANVVAVDFVADDAELSEAGIRSWAERVAPSIVAGDVVQAVGAGLAAALAMPVAARSGRPWVLGEHASYVRELEHGQLTLETGRCVEESVAARHALVDTFLGIARDAYGSAACIVALDEATQRFQAAHGAPLDRLERIGNGVALGRAVTPTGPFSVVQVGRICPIKDTLGFVEVAEEVRRVHPDARFVHVGPVDDPAYGELCRRRGALSDSVTFLGPRPRWDFGVGAPHALALTSRSEAQPLAALEAMARGIPVVATDVGACRALIAEGAPAGGAVVPARDPRAVAEVLLRWYEEPHQRDVLAAGAYRRVAASWSWETVLQQYRRLYERLGAQ